MRKAMTRPIIASLAAFGLFACSATIPADTNGTLPDPVPVADKGTEPTRSPLSGAAILFYNVENLYDTEDDPTIDDKDFLPSSEMHWTKERFNTKLENLAEAISMSGAELPVLVGMAEVENKAVVSALAGQRRLAKANYDVVHFDSPDERGIDVALMYSEDRFDLVHGEALTVALPEDDRTRDILHAELKAGAMIYHIFVNHWPSRREGKEKSEHKRMAAAEVLKKSIAGIQTGPDVHIVIMGDLNDWPTDRSVQEGLGAGCDKKGKGLVDLMCVDENEGSGSYVHDGKWQFLDQFIVDAALTKEIASASALRDERLLFNHPKYGPSPNKTYSGGHYKGGYSDHLPIVLRFK